MKKTADDDKEAKETNDLKGEKKMLQGCNINIHLKERERGTGGQKKIERIKLKYTREG